MSAIERFKERVKAEDSYSPQNSRFFPFSVSFITNLGLMRELLTEIEALEKDRERHQKALWFIYNECDWEEFQGTGDDRIGEVIRKVCAEGKTVSLKEDV